MVSSLVSIVIVNWDGLPHLKISLPSLQKINYPNYEIILVDNGSTDGSIEYLKAQMSKLKTTAQKLKLRLIENRKNLGFAKANNQGFKKAKGEYILFLNNDTKVTPDFLTKLVNVMEEDKKIGVVQPKIVFMDSGTLQAGGAFLTNTGFLYHFGFGKDPDDKKYNKRMEIFSANGSCMLVKREVIKKVGLFDPDFFCYFEETDFCWRVWLAGYKVIYTPQALIYHKGGQTARRLKSSFITFHSFKNRICSLILNLSWRKLVRVLPLHFLCCQLVFLFFLTQGQLSSALAIQRAILWNWKNLPKTLKKRTRIQKEIRSIEDKDLFKIIKRKPRWMYYYFLLTGLGGYED